MDIKSLRAMRNNDFSKIANEFEKTANPDNKSYEDKRFWKPERDKAGNATATIRFLSRTEGDELPWVKIFSHGFKGPSGRWYIENSLSTIGKPDPLSELNARLWNSTTDDNSPERKQVREQKRRLNYISNILVVNDPKHPENNGKVFLFKYGKKIFDKIMDKARPTFEDQDPINVFDYWEGANFKLRMKMVDGYPNYDSSEFESPSPISNDDEVILEVVNKQYKLSEFLDLSNFKTYDELKAKLALVLGSPVSTDTAYQVATEQVQPTRTPSKQAEPKVSGPAPKKAAWEEEDTDDVLSYFQQLAND